MNSNNTSERTRQKLDPSFYIVFPGILNIYFIELFKKNNSIQEFNLNRSNASFRSKRLPRDPVSICISRSTTPHFHNRMFVFSSDAIFLLKYEHSFKFGKASTVTQTNLR